VFSIACRAQQRHGARGGVAAAAATWIPAVPSAERRATASDGRRFLSHMGPSPVGDPATDAKAWLRCVRSSFRNRDAISCRMRHLW